jgi:hypothetical protein
MSSPCPPRTPFAAQAGPGEEIPNNIEAGTRRGGQGEGIEVGQERQGEKIKEGKGLRSLRAGRGDEGG